MHELSIAKNLIEMAEGAARDGGAICITRLNLQVGQMSGVVSDALLFCFDIAAQGTLAEGAKLEMVELPAVVHCNACEQEAQLPTVQRFRCPICDSSNVSIVQGRELELISIEVEESVENAVT